MFPHKPEGEFLSVHRPQCHASNLVQRAMTECPLIPKSPICLLSYFSNVFIKWTVKTWQDTTAFWSQKMLARWSYQGTLALLFWGISLSPTRFSHTDFFPRAFAGVLVAYEGLPLHLALFPKLWTELCQTQVRVSFRTNSMETQAKHTECGTKSPQF